MDRIGVKVVSPLPWTKSREKFVKANTNNLIIYTTWVDSPSTWVLDQQRSCMIGQPLSVGKNRKIPEDSSLKCPYLLKETILGTNPPA